MFSSVQAFISVSPSLTFVDVQLYSSSSWLKQRCCSQSQTQKLSPLPSFLISAGHIILLDSGQQLGDIFILDLSLGPHMEVVYKSCTIFLRTMSKIWSPPIQAKCSSKLSSSHFLITAASSSLALIKLSLPGSHPSKMLLQRSLY